MLSFVLLLELKIFFLLLLLIFIGTIVIATEPDLGVLAGQVHEIPAALIIGVVAIGSGGNYALAAARALAKETDYSAEVIANKALKIASEICVFTNDNIICEKLGEEE